MPGRIDAAKMAGYAKLIPESHGLVEKGTEWWIEMIAIPKSSVPKSALQSHANYRRGGWTFGLNPGMALVSVPFVRDTGASAIGLVLRDKDEDFLAGWFDASRADEVARIAAHLNAEIAHELARYSSPLAESITLEIGNEHAPDSPFGTERVTLMPTGAIDYEQRNRGSIVARTGRADAGLWKVLSSALAKTSFPRPPQESFLPGGSMMRLTVEGTRSGQVLLDYHDALDMEGYRELTEVCSAIAKAFREAEFEPVRTWNLRPD